MNHININININNSNRINNNNSIYMHNNIQNHKHNEDKCDSGYHAPVPNVMRYFGAPSYIIIWIGLTPKLMC